MKEITLEVLGIIFFGYCGILFLKGIIKYRKKKS